MPESDNLDCTFEEDDMEALIHAIKKNECILMLGPDTATEEVNKIPVIVTETLANQLSKKIKADTFKRINHSDMAQVSQYYVIEKGRHSLESKVSTFYQEKQSLCSQLHHDLAALPFYFTITTTPDSMFINALKKEKKQPVMDYYNFKGKKREMVQMGTVEAPLVFYLYGSLEKPESLLLTENDLLDFLVALISETPALPYNIRSELQDANKIFLFIGFGFKQWYLRILLHVLRGKNKKTNCSFALEKFPLENSSELQHAVFFFRMSDYRIHIFDEDYHAFAKKLREDFSNCTPDVVTEIEAENMPEVFICHASEDKDHAASLYKKLEQAGIRPWLDKENLRGGDYWDNLIKETIKKIDYFIVMQSKALNEKKIGYVNKEIYEALERKKHFRDLKFIIPIKIDKSKELKQFEELNTIDLAIDDNIKELINDIQRDFEKRKERNK